MLSTSGVLRFLTVASVLCVSVASYAADTCNHRIHFLPQSHEAEDVEKHMTPEHLANYLDKVAKSQLKIAQHLDRTPKWPVFSEQAPPDFSYDTLPHKAKKGLARLMKQVFPNGIDIDPNKLTILQKQKLKANGGEFIQLMRGRLAKIQATYRTEAIKNEIFDQIDAWWATNPNLNEDYPPAMKKLVRDEREKEALRTINVFFENNPDTRDVVLIYGANHHFGLYPDLFPPECVVVPREFAYNWLGAFRTNSSAFGDNRERGSSPGAQAGARAK